jgi:hypothetical protein
MASSPSQLPLDQYRFIRYTETFTSIAMGTPDTVPILFLIIIIQPVTTMPYANIPAERVKYTMKVKFSSP